MGELWGPNSPGNGFTMDFYSQSSHSKAFYKFITGMLPEELFLASPFPGEKGNGSCGSF